MDEEALERRLSAVERALTNDTSEVTRPEVEHRIDDLESRVRELEAATQALRGYVGDVRDRDTQGKSRPDSDLHRVQRMDVRGENQGRGRRQSSPMGSLQDRGSAEPDGGILDRLAAWL